MIDLNKFYIGESSEFIKNNIPDNSIDLTVTSPPYSDLRNYNGFAFDFDSIAKELYRVTKPGGVVVWVVGDKTINGKEELVPFRQCLGFSEIGFNVWDTMIYTRTSPFPANVRYNQEFEFMFVLSKGKVKTFNPLKESKSEKELEKLAKGGTAFKSKSYRNKSGETIRADSDERIVARLTKSATQTEKTMGNVWKINAGYMVGSKDIISFDHPATFPEEISNRHILSWSNPGDVVLDPFCGSGTTCKSAYLNDRKFIGIDMSEEYVNNICIPRMKSYGWDN